MTSFAGLGVIATRRFVTSSVSLSTGAHLVGQRDGIEVAGASRTKLELTLPRPSAVVASFVAEGLGEKLVKLFKKELQTGDPEFDDAVYVSTDTPGPTAAWLAAADVRATVVELIGAGATIEVDHATVRVALPGHEQGDDPSVVRLVESLLTRG